MLLPTVTGYKITLKAAVQSSRLTRQRFSFAHELGHLLLMNIGYSRPVEGKARHRMARVRNEEEIICDQIAAEILMPRNSFVQDADRMGWDLRSLRPLARLYETSIPATARRMIDLMGESCLMSVWKPAPGGPEGHSLEDWHCGTGRFGVPSPVSIATQRLWLVGRAAHSREIEEGAAPVVDKRRPRAVPSDVPAEAWAWGRDEFRKVMVYYYPARALTDEMVGISKITR